MGRSRRLLVLWGLLALGLLVVRGALAQEPEGIGESQGGPAQWQLVEANVVEADEGTRSGHSLVPLDPAMLQNMPEPANLQQEQEPNNSAATANALGSRIVTGYIYAGGDADYYSFTATAGDRVYAATMTAFSPSSGDTVLAVIGPDGTTVSELDNDDGTFGGAASSIAGTVLASSGTYYLRVTGNGATIQVRPYRLTFQLHSGLAVAETEPNNSPPQPLPPANRVSGVISPTADVDLFSINLNAGDTIYISLDADPERDTVTWNPRLGMGLFNNVYLVTNDGNVTSPNSEAFFITVRQTGSYTIYVDAPVGGSATASYQLSATVYPGAQGANCTTYTSANVPVAIPTGPGLVSSTLTVPSGSRISDLNVNLQLNHANPPDLDLSLVSPQGNEVGLFTDIGANTRPTMSLTLDDEAGSPVVNFFTVVQGMISQPEPSYRLGWFYGEDPGGTWTLNVRDDTAANGGTLQSWGLTLCTEAAPATCPAGTVQSVIYASDFETGDGGFTHSGTQDEWARGLPTAAPITTCNSGSACWKTDLTSTYNANSIQNLLSPNINLTGTTYQGPVLLSWAQRYQMESASFDHAYADIRQVGGGSTTRLWEWLDGTMTDSQGNPIVTINESSGWSLMSRDISSYLGQNVELLFHLDSDNTVNLAGLAVDDVTVTACRLLPDLSLTKSASSDPVVAGTPLSYTLTVSSTNAVTATNVVVTDTLPANVTFVSASPAVCTEGPTDTIVCNLGSVQGAPTTVVLNVTVDSDATCGGGATLTNNAVVGSGDPDLNPANNSASATVQVNCAPADLGLSKAATPSPVVAGSPLTYTLTVTNSSAVTATNVVVTDTLPTDVTFVSASPAVCTEGPTDTIVCNLGSMPAGTRTIALQVTVDGGASCGPKTIIINNAVVGSTTPDPEPANNSASAAVQVDCPPTPAIVLSTAALTATQSVGTTTTQSFSISNNGTAPLTWSIIEEAALPLGKRTAGGGCVAQPIPWATVAPPSGTTAPAGATGVIVTFDSTGLAVGTYTGTLCVSSNDLENPEERVGLTLIVTAPTAVALADLRTGAGSPALPTTLVAAMLGLVAGGYALRRRRRA